MALCAAAAVAAATVGRGAAHSGAARPEAERPVVPTPVAESWVAIPKPVRIYSFEAPAFRGLPATYAARRHVPRGGREDTLALGTFGPGTPMLRISLFRRAGETAEVAPLPRVLARVAADAGLTSVEEGPFRPADDRGAARGQGERIPTRFGPVEVLDLALAGGGRIASCGGFRLVLDRPGLAMTGLACAADGRPMRRKALGCLIERLDLASARDDGALTGFFAASELRRDAGCAGMGLGPNAARAARLDDISDTDSQSLRQR